MTLRYMKFVIILSIKIEETMHTLQLQVDDSIFDKFMGLLDILPKEKISVTDKSNAISFEEAFDKVLNLCRQQSY